MFGGKNSHVACAVIGSCQSRARRWLGLGRAPLSPTLCRSLHPRTCCASCRIMVQHTALWLAISCNTMAHPKLTLCSPFRASTRTSVLDRLVPMDSAHASFFEPPVLLHAYRAAISGLGNSSHLNQADLSSHATLRSWPGPASALDTVVQSAGTWPRTQNHGKECVSLWSPLLQLVCHAEDAACRLQAPCQPLRIMVSSVLTPSAWHLGRRPS